MKKKTHAEVSAAFEAEGYKLLGQYAGASLKMNARCPEGHAIQVTWHGFKAGKRCPKCALVNRANKRRTDPALVKSAFQKAGYRLLEEYRRNSIRMKCICPNRHCITMDWASFQDGVRCQKCMAVERGKTRKYNVANKAKRAFEEAGYTLIDNYVDSHTAMQFICPNNHQHQISWTNFSQGYRCAICSGNGPVYPDDVQAAFRNENYKLLDQYKNSRQKLRFICPNGHKYSITWDSWRSGHRCAICSGKIVTPKQVKDAFKAEGYTLETPYRWQNTQKLRYTCDKGHSHETTWAYFQDGNRCPTCKKRYVDPQVVYETFLADGYKPLAEYKNSSTKIPYRCPNGHEHSMLWGLFKNGTRCPECQGKILRHEDVVLAFASDGYELLDQYQNSHTHMRYICPEGHQHSIIWDAFKQGVRCPYCAGMRPTPEEKRIGKIRHDIASHIWIYVRRQKAGKPFPSVTCFAALKAKEIYEMLGDRPEGTHLDHIIPQSFFDFRKESEVRACWHIENLRWLPSLDNICRSNRLMIEEVERFSEIQLRLLSKASMKPPMFDDILLKKGIIKKSICHTERSDVNF